MKRHCVVLAASMSLVAGWAHAGVVAIGEFSGEMSEGFEAILPPAGYPGPLPMFNDTATWNDTVANFCVIAVSWWGPAGDILPYNGNFMGGTVAGSALFEFSTPVKRFGGYFNTIGMIPDGTVVLRDADGLEIASLPLELTPTQWGWQGWQSTTPIGSVEIIGANAPGIGVQFDDLHISFVPAPGSVALLGIAGLAARRRR